MKVKKKYFSLDYLWYYAVISLLYLKLTFSYLIVEHSYWIRHLPSNFEAFNIFGVSKDFTNKMEYLLLPLLLGYIILNFKSLGRLKTVFVFSFGLLFSNCITYLFNNVSFMDSINYSLKILSPLFLFFSFIIITKKGIINYKTVLINLIKYCSLLVLIGLIFFEISMNRKEVQLPIFFSNIHTHSYIVATIFIFSSYILYTKRKILSLIGFFIITFLFLYFGYSVRTATLLYLIYIMAVLYINSAFFKYVALQILFFIPLMFLAVVLIFDLDVDSLSSGRITMYSNKIEILKEYNFKELMFGRGYGSDFIRTEEWWWDEKGSHSDFITYIIENGILYLMLFVSLILSIIPIKNKLNIIILSLLIGYLFTSVISNGIAVRPLSGYLFFMVLVYVYNETYTTSLPDNNQITKI